MNLPYKNTGSYKSIIASLSNDGGASSFLDQNKNVVSGLGTTAGGLWDNYTQETETDAYGKSYKTQSNFNAVGSNALKWAGMGATLGPWGAAGGAVLGGAIGLINNNRNNEFVEKAKEEALKLYTDNRSNEAITNLKNMKAQGFNDQGGYSSIYRKGGYLPNGGVVPGAEYEVEGGEMVQGDNVMLEGQEQVASDMTKAVGPTHEQGGVAGVGGERVFSNRLKASPALISILSATKVSAKETDTYADIAEKIAKKKAKFEDKLKSPTSYRHATGKVMTERMDMLTELVFQDQEFSKEEETMNKSFAMGGKLPKYSFGGRPVKGAINPDTQQPYTEAEATALDNSFVDPFSTYISVAEPNVIKPKIGMYSPSKSFAPATLRDKRIITDNPNQVPNTSSNKSSTTSLLDNINWEQGVNTAVYLANLKNTNKMQTGYKREVGRPSYMKRVNMLPFTKEMISKEARTAGVAVDRMSGNVQDTFGRKSAIAANAMEAINNAAMQQAQIDVDVNNRNTAITNDYINRKASATNAELEDRVINENAIITNRQGATNAWLQGVMGNLASKRAYDVERQKLFLARALAGDRGTDVRFDSKIKSLVDAGTITKKDAEDLGVKFSKGGYIKRKGGYC